MVKPNNQFRNVCCNVTPIETLKLSVSLLPENVFRPIVI
jgi:hypothetical protein